MATRSASWISLALFALLCFGNGQESPSVSEEFLVKRLGENSNIFSQKLYGEVSTADKSLVYSPFSLHSALTMAMVGAQGDTLREMWTVLGNYGLISRTNILDLERRVIDQLISAPNVTARLANALYINPSVTIKPSYISDIRKGFLAEADNLDFEAEGGPEKKVNAWVSDKTNGLIDEAFKPNSISNNVLAILINTVFFNGSWEIAFEPKRTQPEDFHKADGSVAKVDMMTYDTYKKVALTRGPAYDTLELPYKGGQFSFFIVLPKDSAAMKKLEESSTARLDAILGFKKLTLTPGTKVKIPKFEIKTDLDLVKNLRNLGMRKPFEAGAEFPGISESSMSISQVIHQAFISVQEGGTEAAAMTALTFERGLPIKSGEFIANKPFLFFLQDKVNEEILFQGKFIGE